MKRYYYLSLGLCLSSMCMAQDFFVGFNAQENFRKKVGMPIEKSFSVSPEKIDELGINSEEIDELLSGEHKKSKEIWEGLRDDKNKATRERIDSQLFYRDQLELIRGGVSASRIKDKSAFSGFFGGSFVNFGSAQESNAFVGIEYATRSLRPPANNFRAIFNNENFFGGAHFLFGVNFASRGSGAVEKENSMMDGMDMMMPDNGGRFDSAQFDLEGTDAITAYVNGFWPFYDNELTVVGLEDHTASLGPILDLQGRFFFDNDQTTTQALVRPGLRVAIHEKHGELVAGDPRPVAFLDVGFNYYLKGDDVPGDTDAFVRAEFPLFGTFKGYIDGVFDSKADEVIEWGVYKRFEFSDFEKLRSFFAP